MKNPPFAGVALSMALAGAGVSPPLAAEDQHDHGAPGGRLGTVHFETSCSPGVEKVFDRGVALLHSFWFSAAIDAFSEVLNTDPDCVMAHWGIAMSWWGNPFGGFRTPQALQAGTGEIDRGMAAGVGTARERAYLAAVDTLYRDADSIDQRTRTLRYEKAMEQLAASYPEDPEARIFYALALDQTALPTDKSYTNLLLAAAILEKEFAQQPDHPGITHYIIHSFDVPPLAPRALDAARRYARIAPAAAHALHMPSHTFTRVGAWQESINTNEFSAAAAHADNQPAEELHARDYQVYAYLQMARDEMARKTMEAIGVLRPRIQMTAPGGAAPPSAGYYALAAIPARYALERNAWKEAAELERHESAFAWADAITYFARALGAARSGDTASAAKDLEKLDALHQALVQAKDAYWSEQVDIQRQVATAWIEHSRGRTDQALTMLRAAADREDATEKSAVTPGPIKPARELLGEMLLETQRPAEALREFEAVMSKEQGRFRATYGAARAAQAAGDHAKARMYFSSVIVSCKGADVPGRPELQEAMAATRSGA